MARHISRYRPGDPIYSFVSHNGENIHIDSRALREWCIKQPNLEVVGVPVDLTLAHTFLKENAVIPSRLEELARRVHLDPVIFCMDGKYTDGKPDVLLVDGHHRYFLAAYNNLKYVPSHVLTPAQWKPFRIVGHPDMTIEELRCSPAFSRRNY